MVMKKLPLLKSILLIFKIIGLIIIQGAIIQNNDFSSTNKVYFTLNWDTKSCLIESFKESIHVIIIPILLTRNVDPDIIYKESKLLSMRDSNDFSF
jgi:hypothetical protein